MVITMDDKTEELRDIFVSVSGTEEVTESQAEPRGSLSDEHEADLAGVVEAMRERYDFDADLSTAAYCRVAEAVYDGADDAAVGDAADLDEATAGRARLDLHLYRDGDFDVDFRTEGVDERVEAAGGEAPESVAEELAPSLDADPDTVERYARAAAARTRSLRANRRFRARFDEVLSDSDLSARHAEGIQEDGLEDATEGVETDVSF